MWNETLWSYFDFNATSNAQNIFYPADNDTDSVDRDAAPEGQQVFFSVAQLYPFWTGAAPEHLKNNPYAVLNAYKRVSAYLDARGGGIPATNFRTSEQWDQPNVWPPLMHILMDALLKVPPTFGLSDPSFVQIRVLANRLAQRYVDSTFCTWYATGGSTSETPQLEGLSSEDEGIMFEKYADNSTNLAGGGGEYEVVEGFGWTNGVLLWAVDNFHDRLRTPECGDIEAADVETKRSLSAVMLNARDANRVKKFGRRKRAAKRAAKRSPWKA